MKLVAVLRGRAAPIAAKSGRSGIFKTPIDGPVRIDAGGLAGDVICDTKHHGGPDQAIYAFGDRDRRWWEAELSREVPPGTFGENLLISDLESATLAVGDQIAVGSVLLEVTSPRVPCATLAARMEDPGFGKRFLKAGRSGAYLRVLDPGKVGAGDLVKITAYDQDRVTLSEILEAYSAGFRDLDFRRRLACVPAHHNLRNLVDRPARGLPDHR